MKVKGGWKLFVAVLAVVVIVAAIAVPLIGGAVAVGRPTVDSGPPVAGTGQRMVIAEVTPTPEPVICQNGTACGG
jgi:hypothetical protein